ncbi:MAG: prolipoprotein diacylglyceryl transferase [Verrucomicrobiaceae bacterium]|nr:prolipoprotein diacylglyceryl transferase [Verrucomicrobiaceae bacterium]
MLAFYLHDLDPVALRLSDSLAVRWYGLSYVLGFVLVFFIVRRFIRRGVCEIKEEGLLAWVVLGAFFAVVVGGRLGYVLLYALAEGGMSWSEIVQPQRGGMSAHGAIAGIGVYCWCYARWHRIHAWNVIDAVSCSAPLGVFFGRLGNFVNGELFGRVTSVPWAVKFPTELLHEDFIQQGGASVALPSDARSSPEIIAFFEREAGGRENLEALLHPRHPSQIYEALGEGLLMFALLYWLRMRFPKLPHGVLTAIFLLGYAVVRIAVEQFRQPDSGAQAILGLTRGQFFSLFMIVGGVALLVRAKKI